jgi:hypothetical protein
MARYSKIFVKWQPRKCSQNSAAGEIFNTSKKIIKGPQIQAPPRAGPRAAAPPALRLILVMPFPYLRAYGRIHTGFDKCVAFDLVNRVSLMGNSHYAVSAFE